MVYGVVKKAKWIFVQSLAYLSFYYLTNYIAFVRGVDTPWLISSIDGWIPFMNIFIWPYITAYLLNTFGVILITLKLDYEDYRKILTAYFINLAIAISFYLIIPMQAIRPSFPPDESLNTWAMLLLHEAMLPFNTFPSAHVSYSFLTLITTFWAKPGRVLTSVITIDVILVILSTLFIKEHVVADVIGGILAAILSFMLRKKIYNLYTKFFPLKNSA